MPLWWFRTKMISLGKLGLRDRSIGVAEPVGPTDGPDLVAGQGLSRRRPPLPIALRVIRVIGFIGLGIAGLLCAVLIGFACVSTRVP